MSKLTTKLLIFVSFFFVSTVGFSQEGNIKKSTTFDAKSGKQPVKAKKANTVDAQKKSPEKPGTKSVNAGKDFPADFPKFVNTGNADADNEKYRIAKEEWVAKNPERYEALKNSSPKVKVLSKEEFNKLPAEKQKVILENPTKYQVK
jgi:hypothetical protein